MELILHLNSCLPGIDFLQTGGLSHPAAGQQALSDMPTKTSLQKEPEPVPLCQKSESQSGPDPFQAHTGFWVAAQRGDQSTMVSPVGSQAVVVSTQGAGAETGRPRLQSALQLF